MPNKDDQEQKPRKESPTAENAGAPRNEINDDDKLKIFNKPWKDDAAVIVEDYDERRAPGTRQQLIFDAWKL